MNLSGKNLHFRQQKTNNRPYIALILIGLVILGLFILRAISTDQIRSPFLPTPIPTRTASSYVLEADTNFKAGNLAVSINAYKEASRLDPENPRLLSELARIQVYSSALLTTDAEKRTRLADALQSINAALKLAPDDSTVHAVRAFVLDWYSNKDLSGDKAQDYLTEAEQEARRAIQLDNQNSLALAYYAEILVDQQNLLQAEQYIRQALERDPNLMDVHRVNAYVQESLGNYGKAIDEYKAAVKITPNLTFLYINIGVNYRQLKQYPIALENFAKAVTINEQLQVKDPIAYLAIGKTYAQLGEFYAAAQNVRKALQYNPNNPDVYGSLGVVYFKSRNYEGAIPALKCSVRGCTAEESCKVRNRKDCTAEQISQSVAIQNLPLSGSTVAYYFQYGSVLAGMHQPNNNYCEEAMKVLEEVRQKYSGDPTVMQIVNASENICISYGYTR
jgi:tetratricopeptide (TPR) repeat protein